MAILDDLRLDDENFPPAKGKKAIPTYIDKLNDLIDYIEDAEFYELLSTYNNLASNLEGAVAAIGSTETVLIINTTVDNLTANLTIPATLRLVWKKGYALGGAYTLTINGGLDAGPYQIFATALTVSYGDYVREILPEWYGADPTNIADSSVQLRKAIIEASGKQVLLTGAYRVDTLGSVDLTVSVNLQGKNGAFLDGNDLTTSRLSIDKAGTIDSVRIDGVRFYQMGRWPVGVFTNTTLSQFTFTNNIIEDCINGVYIHCIVSNVFCSHNRITGISDSTTACYGFTFGQNLNADQASTTRIVVTDNIIQDVDCSHATSGAIGILARASDVLVSNNYVENVRNSNDAAASSGIYLKAIFGKIQNNIIKSCGGTGNGALTVKGLDRGEGGADARGYSITISGNSVYHTTGAYRGIFIDDSDVLCSDNYIEGFGLSAILINNNGFNNISIDSNVIKNHRGETAIQVSSIGGKGFRITNNVIDGMICSQGTITTASALRIQQQGDIEDVVVSGNSIRVDEDCEASSGVIGLYIKGATGTIDGLSIQNNDIDISHDTLTNMDGLLIFPVSTGTNVVVEGNNVKCPQSGANEKPFSMVLTNIPSGEFTVRGNRTWDDPQALIDPLSNGMMGIYTTDVGATGTFTPTLPSAKIGMDFGFLKTTAQTFNIDPASGERHRGGTADQNLQLGATGDTVRIQCLVEGVWEVVGGSGTYSYV